MTDHLPNPDSDNTSNQWDAIARFLAGEASASEAAEARQWFAAHPADSRAVEALDELLTVATQELSRNRTSSANSAVPVSAAEVESALRKLHARMQTSAPVLELSVSSAQSPPPRVLQHRTGARLAAASAPTKRNLGVWQLRGMIAAAAVIAAIGINSWRLLQTNVPTVATTYDSKVGERDSVMLPDSSRVILAPGSRLVVAANYGQGERSVELRGAGQFTVRHDATRPFSVRVGSAIIKDLGTVFAVKATERSGIVVSVTEGSVSLGDASGASKSPAVELKAGDRGRMMADGSVVSEPGKVTPDETAWVGGRLVYHDTPLDDVRADLRSWYGVDLVVGDAGLAKRTVNTNGSASEPVEKILERLEVMLEAKAVRKGNTVYLDPIGARSKH